MVKPSSRHSFTSRAGDCLQSIPRATSAAASQVTVVPIWVIVYLTRCRG